MNINELDNIIDKNDFINNIYPKVCNKPYTPSIFEKTHRIIVIGDIHADFVLALKLLKIAKVIEIVKSNKSNKKKVNWIGGKTVVVQLGDVLDGCRPINGECISDDNNKNNPSDIKILKLFHRLNEQAEKVGGKLLMLLGNHEIMNVEGIMNYVSTKDFKEFEKYDKNKSGIEGRKYAFLEGNKYAKYMGCNFFSSIIIGNNFFIHGGFVDKIIKHLEINDNHDDNDKRYNFETINKAIKLWLFGMMDKKNISKIIEPNDNSLFWNRQLGNLKPNTPFENKECKDNIEQVLKLFKFQKMYIGHTPQSFINDDNINLTCEHVWRLDNGSSGAFNHWDKSYSKNKIVNKKRMPQVLEIIDDTHFNVRYDDDYDVI
jgi:hypothetical protein